MGGPEHSALVAEAMQPIIAEIVKYEGEEPEEEGFSHVFLAAMGVALLGVGYLVITMFYKK